MGKYFGTDGVRGVANKTLKKETVYAIGRFLGHYFSIDKHAKIVIGMDTRESSKDFSLVLADAITRSDCDAYLLDYCSTPCLAFTAQSKEFACGIMISASHNPYYDNGIKVFGNNGLKIGEQIESLIEEYIDNPVEYEINKIGKVVDYANNRVIYQDWLLKIHPLNLNGMKLCADLCNGSNSYMAKYVLDKCNCNITYINDSPNGTNINNNCGSTHLEMLSETVKNGDYALGFAFDGDADRVLFVGRSGNTIDGDQVMYILAKYLKDTGKLEKDTLVTTVMSNIGLFKALDKLNIKYEVTNVGDKNVADCILKNGFTVGGEQSGHIICNTDSMFGDGLKTVMLVLEALMYYKDSIEQVIEPLHIYPQLLVNEKVKDKKIVLDDEQIKDLIAKISQALDGNGRILVRPSGTEPLIRVMVEAETDEICHKYVYEVIDLIKSKGYAEA